MKNRKRKYWAGYVDGKLDEFGWSLFGRNDVTELVSIFRTRKTARKVFADVRPVYIIPADKPKRGK